MTINDATRCWMYQFSTDHQDQQLSVVDGWWYGFITSWYFQGIQPGGISAKKALIKPWIKNTHQSVRDSRQHFYIRITWRYDFSLSAIFVCYDIWNSYQSLISSEIFVSLQRKYLKGIFILIQGGVFRCLSNVLYSYSERL